MTETVPASAASGGAPAPQGSSLRRLVPRIFSRTPSRNGVEQLVRIVRTHHPKGDVAIIERAYQTAARAHASQKRQSGEPYITHPLAVAQIIAELKLDVSSVCAGLLHDCVEDTSATI